MMYSAKTKDILYILFPEYYIYEDELPSFLPDGKYILYGGINRCPEETDTLKVIFISKNINHMPDLSKKDTLINYLISDRDVFFEKDAIDVVLKMDFNVFWRTVPYFILEKKITPRDLSDVSSIGVYTLFEHISSGFVKTYPLYKKINQNYKTILSALVTMFSFCIDENLKASTKEHSPWFLGVISQNKKYLKKFKSSIIKYLNSDQSEMDFFTFLYDMGDL